MFNARTFRLPTLLLAFGAFAALTAYANHHGNMPDSARAEKRIDRFVGKMEKDLKLGKEQSEKIRAILRKDPVAPHHGMGGHGKEYGHSGGHSELVAQLRSGVVDTAAFNRAFEERVGAMRARHASMTAKFAEIHAMLTPEQRKKAADLLEKRGAKMEKKHKRKCDKDCPPF
jgi:Spy/CpxP family protein refolding chaperone